MINLENIAFTPIDLPGISFKEELLSAFNEVQTNMIWDHWLEYILLDDSNPYGTERCWKEETKEKFPLIIEYIKTYLPFEQMMGAKFFRAASSTPRPTHVDFWDKDSSWYDYHTKYPFMGYRILISGNRKSFYVCKDRGDPKDRVFTDLPLETDTFLVPFATQCHSSTSTVDDDPGRLILLLDGVVNQEKHQQILRRSIEKYKDYCVFRSDLP